MNEQSLAKELSLITHKCLSKNIKHTVLNFVDLSSCYSNGGDVCESSLSVDIKVTAGTNSETEKSNWIRGVWEILQTYISNLDKTINYISISEIESNTWGYNGLTQKVRTTTGDKK